MKTVNEVRAAQGLAPLAGGDTATILAGNALVPLAQATNPLPPAPLPQAGKGGARAPGEGAAKYAPDQPRDDRGRWTDGGEGGDSSSAEGAQGASPARTHGPKPAREIQVADSGQTMSDAEVQVAQSEEEEPKPEEELDPMAEVRVAEFRAKYDLLREIDPDNKELTYMSSPDWVPTNEDLARMDSAIEQASIKRVTDFVMPGGQAIGRPGGGSDIREADGGIRAAEAAFEYVRAGGTVIANSNYPGTLVRLPGNAGYVGLRASSSSGPPALDLRVTGVPYRTIHYLGDR